MGQFLRTPEGKSVYVEDDQLQHALATDLTPESTGEAGDTITTREAGGHEGLAGSVNAGATGLLSGMTLGGSDVLLGGLMNQGQRRDLTADKEDHPIVSGVSQAIGMIAPSLLGAGPLANTPSGLLSKFAGEGIEAGKAVGGIKGLAKVAGYSGIEGAAQNAGMYLSDTALGDRDLTAEGMAGALGRGFAFGAVPGGAMYGLEKGAIAARRLFARTAEGGAEAAASASGAWERESERVIGANDATADIAKARLDEIKLAKGEANLATAKAQQGLAESKLKVFNEKQAVAKTKPAMDFLDKYRVTEDGSMVAPEAAAEVAPVAESATVSPSAQVEAAPVEAAAAPAAPTPAPAPRPQTLEEQLGEMKSRLDNGQTFEDLQAAGKAAKEKPVLGGALEKQETELTEALTEYQKRRAAVSDWVKKIKNPRVSRDIEMAEDGTRAISRGTRTQALDADVMVEQSSGKIRTIGKMEHSLEDLTPNSRILARSNGPEFRAGAKLDEAYDDAIHSARLAETPELRAKSLQEAADIEQQIHAQVRAHKPENASVIDTIEAKRAEAGKTGYHAAEKRMTRQIADEEAAKANGPFRHRALTADEKAIAAGEARIADTLPEGWSKPGSGYKPPNTLDEVHEAADVLGNYEKASAKLSDAVGDAAPQASKDAAVATRKAEDEATRKHLDRTARAADDAAKRQAPRAIATKAETAAPQAAKVETPKLMREAGTAKTPKAAAEVGAASGGIGDKVKSVMGAYEIAGGMAGLPSIHDIPVVGPLLSMYLKARTLLGKLNGRIPASGEARAAALAAKTKDRVVQAVDRALAGTIKAAPYARTISVAATGRAAEALSKRIWDDGSPNHGKDATVPEMAATRAREIHNAVANPQAFIASIREQTQDIKDPDLLSAIEKQKLGDMQYLAPFAPQEPPPSPLTKTKWTPNPAETAQLVRRLDAIDDPVSVIEQIQQKSLSVEAAETVRARYPKLFAMAQNRLLEQCSKPDVDVPYQTRIRMGTLFDVALDRSLEPDSIHLLQAAHAPTGTAEPAQQQTTPPTPSVAGNVNLQALFQTPADRRAARR